MQLVSYKIINISHDGIEVQYTYDTEVHEDRIQSDYVARDVYIKDENGEQVYNKDGRPATKLEFFRLYDPKDPNTIHDAILEYSRAYIRGKMVEVEEDKNREPSDDVKQLIGKEVQLSVS